VSLPYSFLPSLSLFSSLFASENKKENKVIPVMNNTRKKVTIETLWVLLKEYQGTKLLPLEKKAAIF
jgi:uncharacterized FlgJ-related protein